MSLVMWVSIPAAATILLDNLPPDYHFWTIVVPFIAGLSIANRILGCNFLSLRPYDITRSHLIVSVLQLLRNRVFNGIHLQWALAPVELLGPLLVDESQLTELEKALDAYLIHLSLITLNFVRAWEKGWELIHPLTRRSPWLQVQGLRDLEAFLCKEMTIGDCGLPEASSPLWAHLWWYIHPITSSIASLHI